MKKHNVELRVTLVIPVEVEADNFGDAINIAGKKYNAGEIDLNSYFESARVIGRISDELPRIGDSEFRICVDETLHTTVDVFANTEEEAIGLVRGHLDTHDIINDCDSIGAEVYYDPWA